MTDLKFREAEKSWQQNPTPDSFARLYCESKRSGQLFPISATTDKTLLNEYGFREAFEYDYSTKALDNSSLAKPTIAGVEVIISSFPGENDADAWELLVELNDGRFAYLHAACDYSGFG